MMNVETALLSAVQKLMLNPKFNVNDDMTAFYTLSAEYDGPSVIILKDRFRDAVSKQIPKVREMLPGAKLTFIMVMEQYDTQDSGRGWEEHELPIPGDEQPEPTAAEMAEDYRLLDEITLNSESQKTAELLVYNRSAACRRRASDDDDD